MIRHAASKLTAAALLAAVTLTPVSAQDEPPLSSVELMSAIAGTLDTFAIRDKLAIDKPRTKRTKTGPETVDVQLRFRDKLGYRLSDLLRLFQQIEKVDPHVKLHRVNLGRRDAGSADLWRPSVATVRSTAAEHGSCLPHLRAIDGWVTAMNAKKKVISFDQLSMDVEQAIALVTVQGDGDGDDLGRLLGKIPGVASVQTLSLAAGPDGGMHGNVQILFGAPVADAGSFDGNSLGTLAMRVFTKFGIMEKVSIAQPRVRTRSDRSELITVEVRFRGKEGYQLGDLHRLFHALEEHAAVYLSDVDLGKRDPGVGNDIWRPRTLRLAYDERLTEAGAKTPVAATARLNGLLAALTEAHQAPIDWGIDAFRASAHSMQWTMRSKRTDVLTRIERDLLGIEGARELIPGSITFEKDQLLIDGSKVLFDNE